METLTKKQRTVLDYISKRLSAGDNPSQRQIASHLGVSQNAVFQFIGSLKNKGYKNLKLSAGYLMHWLTTKSGSKRSALKRAKYSLYLHPMAAKGGNYARKLN